MPVVQTVFSLEVAASASPGCCALSVGDVTTGILPVPALIDDQAPAPSREPPQSLLVVDTAWRKSCLGRVGHIPSGYTYLAQLMGHDMGSSVPVALCPYTLRTEMPKTPPVRYNLIENPLTLETVYGPGPTKLGHLYDPTTLLFRLDPLAIQAPLIAFRPRPSQPPEGDPVRILFDERNRDTLMLHELAIAWMQFHNRCARRLMAAGQPPWRAYGLARGHVVGVWHSILRRDLLPRFVHPDIGESALDPGWSLDETTLLSGLARAFHALPLDSYPMQGSGPHNLQSLMKEDHTITRAETSWRVDWPLFFGATEGGPKTGISASVAGQLRLPTQAIAAMDLASARTAHPLRLGDTRIAERVKALPGLWPKRLDPAQLTTDFATAFPKAPVTPDAHALNWGPFYQVLMVEAQLHGHKGGFGPFGSALLRASVERAIERVQIAPSGEVVEEVDALETPKTMLELITYVRSRFP